MKQYIEMTSPSKVYRLPLTTIAFKYADYHNRGFRELASWKDDMDSILGNPIKGKEYLLNNYNFAEVQRMYGFETVRDLIDVGVNWFHDADNHTIVEGE